MMWIIKAPLMLAIFFFLITGHYSAMAEYLPNVSPQSFTKDEIIPIHVNVLTSVRTHLPYDYYKDFPTCRTKQQIGGKRGNIGGVLLGDRIMPSPYDDLRVLNNVTCEMVCVMEVRNQKQHTFLNNAIKAQYRVNLLLDGLPLAEVSGKNEYVIGVPLGFTHENAFFINNHLHFDIKFSEENIVSTDGEKVKKYRILSFVGKAYSYDHQSSNGACKNAKSEGDLAAFHPLPASTNIIHWSYSVSWILSKDKWSSRWDVYMNVHRHNVHWFSVINSTFFVAFLTVLIAVIIVRVVRRDLKTISGMDLIENDSTEDARWKLLNRDVFRPPPYCWLLACFVGTGAQLIGMIFAVLVFASLGFFSPQSRGNLFTAVLVCFAFLGIYGGYVSARLLKLWNATKWKYVLATGTVIPGAAFLIFVMMNILLWSQSSSAVVPLVSVTILMGMWLFINVPLVFAGAILGFKREILSVPSSYNQIPRHVPRQPWFASNAIVLLSGFPIFAAAFIEAYYILGALWLNRYYYVFGFLLLVMMILVVTTSEIVVVLIYLSLCAEDYKWWWKSFFIGASSGIYVFLYSAFYVLVGNLRMDGIAPIIIYFGYMALLSFLFSVTTGAVGFLTSFWFVRYIYRYIKVD